MNGECSGRSVQGVHDHAYTDLAAEVRPRPATHTRATRARGRHTRAHTQRTLRSSVRRPAAVSSAAVHHPAAVPFCCPSTCQEGCLPPLRSLTTSAPLRCLQVSGAVAVGRTAAKKVRMATAALLCFHCLRTHKTVPYPAVLRRSSLRRRSSGHK